MRNAPSLRWNSRRNDIALRGMATHFESSRPIAQPSAFQPNPDVRKIYAFLKNQTEMTQKLAV
jgi:hypothetical protein